MNDITSLYEFVDSAQKSRKYPPSTAHSYKVALRLFDEQLNAEEKKSVELFKENLDQLAQLVFTKNKTRLSAGSLAAYKWRVNKLISDYEKYGTDPAKMNSWSRKIVTRMPKIKTEQNVKQQPNEVSPDDNFSIQQTGNLHKFELALRADKSVKFVVVVPNDITKQEAATITSILNSVSIGD
ncbi:MAG: hypothetical protein A2672_00480 [Candidatus Wildermuthbacteria bacterium RIFCSPHIGHO2_01_FULL_49_22b]|uniref:Core-binding (CB) domain-containing protein n=1 Tax=Candidatus Wildermuthbacteria bacterium RIFCSPHIGHO2_01_FULL_49_22b TaxID=1802448 RepID=A0A1G2QY24_9BACT|nr:MAG: hypothetical protein A2672_00480 [Candidatus Wildermuthbacteria bacterium RIFCSPHIGHO2_01_FULL_49_22b]